MPATVPGCDATRVPARARHREVSSHCACPEVPPTLVAARAPQCHILPNKQRGTSFAVTAAPTRLCRTLASSLSPHTIPYGPTPSPNQVAWCSPPVEMLREALPAPPSFSPIITMGLPPPSTPFQTCILIFPFPSSSDCFPLPTPSGKANPCPRCQRTWCPHHYHTVRSKSSTVSRLYPHLLS